MRLIVAILLALTASDRGGAQTSLELRTSCVYADGMTLGDVLDARGDQAEAVRAISIPASVAAPGRALSIADVRELIDGAMPGFDWGATSLSGARCEVARPPVGGPPVAADRGPPGEAPWRVLASYPAGTVGAALAAQASALFGVPAESLRIRASPGDRDRLGKESRGARILIDLAGTGPRISARVRFLDGTALVESFDISGEVQVLRDVLVASKEVPRGRVPEEGDVRAEQRWVAPKIAVATEADLGGREAGRAIREGEPLIAEDFRPAQVVRRGQVMPVVCVAGSLTFRVSVRALSAGVADEVIEVETLEPDRRERRVLRARLSADGSGVLAAPGT